MSIRTLWMDSDGEGALEYFARDFRDVITVLYDPGVLDFAGLKVVQREAGANMSVTVKGPGRAIIESSYTTDMGRYLATLTADETDIAISAAPGSGTRRDIVGLQAQDDAAGGPTGVRETVVVVVEGDTSGSDPALPPSFLPLARVRVPSGTIAITDSLIDDLRVIAGKRDTPGTLRDVAHNLTESGWLECDGSAISRTTYAALFAHIGTTYGVGNGSTTFNLPDHRGRFAVAAADGQTGATRVVTGALGNTGGAKDAIVVAHTHTGPAHTHTGPAHTHTLAHTHSTPDHTHTGTTNTTGNHGHQQPLALSAATQKYVVRVDQYGSGSGLFNVSSAGTGTGVQFNSSPHGGSDREVPTDGNHSHTVTIASGGGGTSGAASSSTTSSAGTGNTGSSGTGATGSTGSAGTNANVPPFCTVRRLIRT